MKEIKNWIERWYDNFWRATKIDRDELYHFCTEEKCIKTFNTDFIVGDKGGRIVVSSDTDKGVSTALIEVDDKSYTTTTRQDFLDEMNFSFNLNLLTIACSWYRYMNDCTSLPTFRVEESLGKVPIGTRVFLGDGEEGYVLNKSFYSDLIYVETDEEIYEYRELKTIEIDFNINKLVNAYNYGTNLKEVF